MFSRLCTIYYFRYYKLLSFFKGIPVREFVGLRAKMYSLLFCDGSEKRTAKGVSKSVIRSELKHSMYKDCLLNRSKFSNNMCLIRSQNHELYCDRIKKTSLSCFDDKRYVKSCGIETLAYGHCDIKTLKNLQNLFCS